jgi:glutamyl-tRNA reductase
MSGVSSHLLVVGLSHRTAPVAIRERAALDAQLERMMLQCLVRDPCVREVVALSTCNRTELYAHVRSPEEGQVALSAALVSWTAIGPGELARSRYVFADEDAVLHLLRVAASLDSMVLGESEIQGQVRQAVTRADAAGTVGPELRDLFRRALITGKRVRRNTGVGRGAVSAPQAAVALAARHMPDLPQRRALVIGAGRAAEATAQVLVGRGLRDLVVLNRSDGAAERLAQRFGGRSAPLSALERELPDADILICSTDSPSPLVSADDVRRALGPARSEPLVVIDIAVPRDVDPAVRNMPGLVLFDVDDLEAVVRGHHDQRRREAMRAELIVRDEADRHLGRTRISFAA